MKITDFAASDAMCFDEFALPLSGDLTVITGPNGAGKTSVARILEIVGLGLRACCDGNWTQLSAAYGDAGRNGAARWQVELGVTFDSDAELRLISSWVRACLLSAVGQSFDDRSEAVRELLVRTSQIGSDDVFGAGRITVEYDRARRQAWAVSWTVPAKRGRKPMTLRVDADNALTMRGVSGQLSVAEFVRSRLNAPGTKARRTSEGRLIRGRKVTFPLLRDLAAEGQVVLLAQALGVDPEPVATREVMEALGLDLRIGIHRAVGFGHLLSHLFDRAVCVCANVRVPPQLIWGTDSLLDVPDLSTGVGLALALFQDKTGDHQARMRFQRCQELFRLLVGGDQLLEVTAKRLAAGAEGTIPERNAIALTPVVQAAGSDIPLHLSGAGRMEAAYLASVLARDWACLVLDEPATNLSGTAQRRVLDAIRQRGLRKRQTVVITHSGHLVPANNPTELRAIVRLTPGQTGPRVKAVSDTDKLAQRTTLHQSGDLRDALFADGVLLVEGGTEFELLSIWLSRDVTPTLHDANVLLIPANGDGSFSGLIDLMEELGIAWAAFADGPALGRALRRREPDVPDEFVQAKAFWESKGVFTVATSFGLDGAKTGEVEHYLRKIDASLWDALNSDQARREPGGRKRRQSKIRAGTAFASATSAPPEIVSIWASVRRAIDRQNGIVVEAETSDA